MSKQSGSRINSMQMNLLGWVWLMIGSLADRQAVEVIAYLQAENLALRELHGNADMFSFM